LQPEFQKNLVEFVKNGGGLLFLGGDRALLEADIRNSPLKEILPFTVKAQQDDGPSSPLPSFGAWEEESANRTGPWYDSQTTFKVSLAQPNRQERALANVYDEWEALGPALTGFPHAQGIHHMENVTFKQGSYTPLLKAVTTDGASIPLAIAS